MRTLAVLIAALLLSACAHQIVIAPDLAKLEATGTAPIRKTAGLYVAADDKAKQVTSPGGGGDEVSYFPYRDLETGVY